MTVKLQVRVTSKRKCRDGFYLIINGQRIRFASRGAALRNLEGWVKLQRVQIVTVNQYLDRNRKKIAAQMPHESQTILNPV